MSAGGSEPSAPAGEPFEESDDHTTTLGYDRGGVPLYIAIAWVVFIVTYIGVMAAVALPDLVAWAGF